MNYPKRELMGFENDLILAVNDAIFAEFHTKRQDADRAISSARLAVKNAELAMKNDPRYAEYQRIWEASDGEKAEALTKLGNGDRDAGWRLYSQEGDSLHAPVEEAKKRLLDLENQEDSCEQAMQEKIQETLFLIALRMGFRAGARCAADTLSNPNHTPVTPAQLVAALLDDHATDAMAATVLASIHGTADAESAGVGQ